MSLLIVLRLRLEFGDRTLTLLVLGDFFGVMSSDLSAAPMQCAHIVVEKRHILRDGRHMLSGSTFLRTQNGPFLLPPLAQPSWLQQPRVDMRLSSHVQGR